MEKLEKIDVGKYRLGKESFYFALTFLTALMVWVWIIAALFDPSLKLQSDGVDIYSVVYGYVLEPSFILTIFLFTFISHFIAMAYIRLNGVKLGPDQLPEIWAAIEKQSQILGMEKPPSAFVIFGHGVMNAFATRLIFRRMIVLYSDLVDSLIEEKDQKQLEAVIAHELGHHALGHTGLKEWFFLPSDIFPFFLLALSRAREYSADRVARVIIGEDEAAIRAFIKLAAGRHLGKRVDIDAYLKQRWSEGGFFGWISEKLATHPHLVNRIAAIKGFSQS